MQSQRGMSPSQRESFCHQRGQSSLKAIRVRLEFKTRLSQGEEGGMPPPLVILLVKGQKLHIAIRAPQRRLDYISHGETKHFCSVVYFFNYARMFLFLTYNASLAHFTAPHFKLGLD